MKVKIIMEADVVDLAPFNCDAGRQNIYDVIRVILENPIEKLMRLETNGGRNMDINLYRALSESYRAEKALAERLIKNAKVEYVG